MALILAFDLEDKSPRKFAEANRNIDGLVKNMDRAGRQSAFFERSLGSLTTVLKSLTKYATVAGGALAAAFSAAAVASLRMASDAERSRVKMRAVFQGQTRDVQAWARTYGAVFGQTTAQTEKMAASIQDLLIPMGFVRDEATKLTMGIAELAGKLSAWSDDNLSAAETAEIFTSALMGQYRGLERLGIKIKEGDLDKYLQQLSKTHTQFLNRTISELSEAEKAWVIYQLALQKSSDAANNFSNMADTFSHKWRRSVAIIKEVGTEVAAPFLELIKENILDKLIEMFDSPEKRQKLILKATEIAFDISRYVIKGLSVILGFLDLVMQKFKQIAEFLGLTTSELLTVGGVAGLIAPSAARGVAGGVAWGTTSSLIQSMAAGGTGAVIGTAGTKAITETLKTFIRPSYISPEAWEKKPYLEKEFLTRMERTGTLDDLKTDEFLNKLERAQARSGDLFNPDWGNLLSKEQTARVGMLDKLKLGGSRLLDAGSKALDVVIIGITAAAAFVIGWQIGKVMSSWLTDKTEDTKHWWGRMWENIKTVGGTTGEFSTDALQHYAIQAEKKALKTGSVDDLFRAAVFKARYFESAGQSDLAYEMLKPFEERLQQDKKWISWDWGFEDQAKDFFKDLKVLGEASIRRDPEIEESRIERSKEFQKEFAEQQPAYKETIFKTWQEQLHEFEISMEDFFKKTLTDIENQKFGQVGDGTTPPPTATDEQKRLQHLQEFLRGQQDENILFGQGISDLSNQIKNFENIKQVLLATPEDERRNIFEFYTAAIEDMMDSLDAGLNASEKRISDFKIFISADFGDEKLQDMLDYVTGKKFGETLPISDELKPFAEMFERLTNISDAFKEKIAELNIELQEMVDILKIPTQEITLLDKLVNQSKGFGIASEALRGFATLAQAMGKENKALLIAAAIASTYASVIDTYARVVSTPGLGAAAVPLAFTAAAGALAFGLAQVAQIKQAHTGGLIGSDKHLKPDEVPMILQTGERVLSRQQNERLENMPSSGYKDIVVNVFTDPVSWMKAGLEKSEVKEIIQVVAQA